MFIFASSSSALLGRPRCGLSISLPYSIHLSEFMPILFKRKWTKHENTRRPPFSYDGHRRLLGAQSINTERAFFYVFVLRDVLYMVHVHTVPVHRAGGTQWKPPVTSCAPPSSPKIFAIDFPWRPLVVALWVHHDALFASVCRPPLST